MRSIISSLLVALLSFACSCTAQPTPPAANSGFAVVELFTSEGCSSCPPAERVLNELKQQYNDKIQVLEFHVDYWNQLGWKDVYSNHDYTLRQQQYAQVMQLSSNYTPQAVVNGTKEMVGSDKSKLTNIINGELSQTAGNHIRLSAASKNSTVTVNFQVTGTPGNALNIALVQKATEVYVKNGENGGRRLKHTNVVREFRMLPANQDNGTIALTLPGGVIAKDCSIIAYTQQKDHGRVTGSTEIMLN